MKSFRIILIIIFTVLFVNNTTAQTRFKDIIFTSAKITRDIQFGSSMALNGTSAPLYLDLFEPEADTMKLRPLVVFIHGGSLISSSRTEMDAYCTDYAQRGYAAATIEYRLGIETPKGVKTILEALLRGVQDTKAAVRFFRSKADEYKVDTSNIYLHGSSAGSMIALHYAYWDPDEVPADIDQVKWGNLEGTSGNPGYSTAVKGIVNYCGAIVDASWVDNNIPVGNFHGLLDNIVPPIDGVSGDFGIRMFGGVTVSRKTIEQGIYSQGAFFSDMGHGGNTDSLKKFSSNFIYTLMVLSESSSQDFTSMEFADNSVKVFLYDDYTFAATALDKNGNRIVLPSTMVEYSCDSRIGTIKPTGIFTPGDHPDSGYVYAKFNTETQSCFVKVYDLNYFVISPHSAVTDSIRPLQLSINTYDADGVRLDLAMTKFVLTSTDPSVGTIDAAGLFKGKKNGTTDIIAECSGYKDTAHITVEILQGSVTLDELETPEEWTFAGNNLDSLIVSAAKDQKSAGEASFKIAYMLTYDPKKTPYMIYLGKELPVHGIPDSIFLDVKSDGRKHKLFYRLEDINGGVFRASGKKFLSDTLKFDKIHTPLGSGLIQVSGGSELTYPLTLKRIEIQLAPDAVQGKVTSGTIYVDNLWLKYPGSTTGVLEPGVLPDKFYLEQNYPNPFNPATTIIYYIPEESRVRLKIYDIQGREAAVLVDEIKPAGRYELTFNARGLASGVYFYQLSAGEFTRTKKLVLLK